jgi:uncharacterized membrane protein
VVDSNKRFWEIDSLRGIAVIMMIIFHFFVDLNYFKVYCFDLYSGIFLIFGSIIRLIFILLVGVSLTLSFSRVEKKLTKKGLKIKFLLRGLKIFGLGMIITIVTWFIIRDGFIIFGVLHSIGISIIIAFPFLKLRFLNFILGLVLVYIGLILKTLVFDFNYLFWIGFKTPDFYTIDYFPLLPWFGVVLIGIFLGNILYSGNIRNYNINDLSGLKIFRLLSYLGRHSLVIYFLHQIILLTIFITIYG